MQRAPSTLATPPRAEESHDAPRLLTLSAPLGADETTVRGSGYSNASVFCVQWCSAWEARAIWTDKAPVLDMNMAIVKPQISQVKGMGSKGDLLAIRSRGKLSPQG
ncbi:hypothetical protein AVEN_151036-1 [Araneus ventricosus]|uniref:Uncharacterized protein n=1 Tax=Araneus ventricosus TaxID=182803 RepID=A0A4Y2IAE5_ARAVE|nr:hypothetical protein AVEN_151036-1 [Araneus ventricosus]